MKKFIFILFIFFTINSYAQAPLKFYTKFGGVGIDIGYSVKPTLDKQYIVAGSTSSYGAGNSDVYLVKVDSMGVPIWAKYFGGFNNDVGKSVIQLPDSGYVVIGFTSSFGAGGYDIYIVKTDKNGNLIWQKTFGGLDWDFGTDLVLAADGDIIVCGNTSSFGSGKKDGVILKYDLFGNLLWQKIIGGTEDEEFRSVIKTNDNLLATVGYTGSKGDVNGDCYFVKFDLNGDTLFTRYFGGPAKDYANDIIQKSSNDYFICGAKTYTSNPKTQSFIYSMNSNGVFNWENFNYASTNDESFVSIANSNQLPNVLAVTRTVPVPSFKMQGNIFLVYHPNGYFYKINSYGGMEDEEMFSFEPTSDGGYVSIGSTNSFGSLSSDVFLIKHDSTIYNYTSVVGIKENLNTNEITISYKNEFSVEVSFQDEMPLNIEILDLNGKLLNNLYPTQIIFDIDLRNYAPSIYFLRFKYSNNRICNKKVIRR